MIEGEHELRTPLNDDEWRAFHDIRRKVLFENRGEFDCYDANHPDDSTPGNHPFILLHRDAVVGVVRVDVRERVAWLRRVAIREDSQRRGHGLILLRLAENFASSEGCTEVRTNAAPDAVGFYERCGYSRDFSGSDSVRLSKSLG
jgi:GNAT superfamily N-acetyltransferase